MNLPSHPPSSIELLPEEVINQIAAGEVIENPSSVVKELVENSLDARSKKIAVDIEGGGQLLIRVADDGFGMGQKNALLSLQRHATSKIRSIEDLWSLASLGFRGEALASIAAISKMIIETKADGEEAVLLHCEGGKIVAVEVGARTRGTTVEVQSLFFNVPVRKKFQKSANANTAEIHRTIMKLSLAHPQCGFSLRSHQRDLFVVSPFEGEIEKAFQSRVKEVMGEKAMGSLLPVETEEGPLKIFGYVGEPLVAKPNRIHQHLLVNQRPVFCHVITQAIREGFGTYLDEQLHPIFFLHCNIQKDWLDVNVHPQKKEIRIREELFVREKMKKTIASVLQRVSSQAPSVEESFFSLPKPMSYQYCLSEKSFLEDLPVQETLEWEVEKREVQGEFRFLAKIGSYVLLDPSVFASTALADRIPSTALCVLDLDGVFCRCLFESFLEAWEQGEKENKEPLLFPYLLELSAEEVVVASLCQEKFLRMGIEIRILGKTSVAIDCLPSFLKDGDLPRIFALLLEELSLFEESSLADRDRIKGVARKICRIVGGKKKGYSQEEMNALLVRWLHCKDPLFHPLGSPVMMALQEGDLARLFTVKGSVG